MRPVSSLPKANLHLHLTGSMRPSTLADLAARYGVPVPPPLAAGVAHPWAAFQSRYDAARVALRSAEDLTRVVREAVADNAADGCGWLELQVDPTSYAARLGGPEPVLEAVLAGVSGAPAGIVVAASWAGSHLAAELARLAARYAGRGVVGFGVSNDERSGRVSDLAPACQLAAEAGLLVVPHGGFYEGAWHVRECVERLGAHRIGHGLTAAADPPTLALLASRRVALEICPPAYPPLGVFPDLSLRALLAAGVPVTLGTDDPLLFGSGLADVYSAARTVHGCTDADLALIARHSVEYSAAPPDIRTRLLAGIDAWYAA